MQVVRYTRPLDLTDSFERSKRSSYPITCLGRPLGPQEAEARRISRKPPHKYGKIVRPRHRPPLPLGNIPSTHFCKRLSRPKGHNAAGWIMSMKTSNENIGTRTRDLSSCSAVPQPTAPPLVPRFKRR